MKRIAIIIASVFALMVPAVLAFSGPAHAVSGDDWCDSTATCLNAWGGGPVVKTYSPHTNNDLFTVIGSYHECNGGFTTSTCPGYPVPAGQAIVQFQFTGGGAWNGNCIGDYGNLSGRADSSLDGCASGNNNGGWGVNFVQLNSPVVACDSGYAVFYNIHWKGYLTYHDSNGQTVFLNGGSAGNCLHIVF